VVTLESRSLRKIVVAISLVVLATSGFAEAASPVEPTVVIVVRHAEKADDGTRDPPLSTEGQERARLLGRLLHDTGVAALYTSDTRRARQTVQPLASALGLVAEEYPGRDVAALIGRVLEDRASQTILIVGHSNTVPEMISILTRGRYSVALLDDEYDALFVVTTGDRDLPALLRLRY
jgi:2,3-bisphosphoglycerate-dependent phosphoglycerate mutase